MPTIKIVAIGAALVLMIAPAAAQIGQPGQSMAVPAIPGGARALLGRVVASGVSELLGKPVVVENVAGAGGMIGADRASNFASPLNLPIAVSH